MPRLRPPSTVRETSFDNTFTPNYDTIRKSCFTTEDEDIVPIPIQLFLWRQSSPYLKQKFGKLTDASSIIFERVLVQNILHGLSPCLTDAITSIPRRSFIRAAFPHVMYACSSTIEHNLQVGQHQSISTNRPSLLFAASPSRSRGSTQLHVPPNLHNPNENPLLLHRSSISLPNYSLNSVDIRLFQTLHHLILYSNNDVLPLNTIQMFIYLFIPYIHTYLRNNEKDFLNNPNLVQGMTLIWQPLFEHRQPNIRIFNSFVKPIASQQKSSVSSDNPDQYSRLSTISESTIQKVSISKRSLTNAPSYERERASLSILPPKPKVNDPRQSKSGVRADSTTASSMTLNSIADLSSYGLVDNTTQRQAPLVHMSSIYSVSDLSRMTISPQSPAVDKGHRMFDLPSPASVSSIPMPLLTFPKPPDTTQSRLNSMSEQSKALSSEYLLLATYFDVAIIRALFSPSWLIDGYLWCLEYLHKRLVDISDKILSDALTIGMLPINVLRFKSLSIPQINTMNEPDVDKYIRKTYINEQVTNGIIEQQSTMTIISKGMKPAHVLLNVPFEYSSGKSFFCQKYDTINRRNRERQLLIKSKIRYIDEDGIEHLDLASTNYYEHFGLPVSPSIPNRIHLTQPTLVLFRTSADDKKDTIIRRSTDTSSNQRQTTSTVPITNLNTMKVYSASDSAIDYNFLTDIKEAQSSSGYINRSGTLNFTVVLAAVHAVICKEHHIKVCEFSMSILDVLFELAVISTIEDDTQRKELFSARNTTMMISDDKENENIEEWLKHMDMKEDDKFQVAVDIILRILKRLGCSNCQSRGRSFNTDQLRGKVRVSLNKLRLLNYQRFEKCFLNFATNANLGHIFDILHALCGYCVETTIGLAHYAPYLPTKTEAQIQQTYANNFANTHSSSGAKGIDGYILNIIFKPFVTRLNLMEKQLLSSENTALYNECRAFLIYVKQNHGGVFRSAVFSSLIDPERKLKPLRQSNNDRKVMKNCESRNAIAENSDQELSTGRPRNPDLLIETDDHSSYAHHEEHLFIDLPLVRLGLLRLNFITDACPPGLLPDPEFLNSLLLLDAPVLSKAAFLLQCAHYVRRCSLGQWPEWMRVHITTYRLHEALFGRANGNPSIKLARIYQAAAARMFYIWGEAIAAQLEIIMNNEQMQTSMDNLWSTDESFEDYYNETIINRSGHECPFSLKLLACLLLYEITSFLRETYTTLPKMSSLLTSNTNQSRQQRSHHAQTVIDVATGMPDKRASDCLRMNSFISQVSNRSTSSILSNDQQPISSQMLSASMGHTIPLPNDRHISFVINNENDSIESAHTIVVVNDDDGTVPPTVTDGNSISISIPVAKAGSISGGSVGKSKFTRRTSIKLRKPSTRSKETSKNVPCSSFRNRSRSHVSNVSSDAEIHQINTINVPSEMQDDYSVNPADDFDHMIKTRPFPWIKTVIRIFNHVNLTCDHQLRCHSTCYDKQKKSCTNLLKALLNMYELKSTHSCSSSIQTQLKHTCAQSHQKQIFSNNLFDEHTMDLPSENETNMYFEAISNYIKKQVGSLIHIPLLLLCKSAVLLDEEHYAQILRLSWQLLLDENEELSACAATIVILTGARASHLVDTLVNTEMTNASAAVRYNSILRFELLWRFRYQFWIRLEEGAHCLMKILPPSIEFVLPSAALGIANLQTVDPPWMPHVKTLVQQVALNQEEVRAVVTTSKTRKKHQQEFIHLALMREENSKRVARENFIMSFVSMLQAASFEPLLHQSREEDEEGHADDDRVNETSVQLRQAQGTLPSVFGRAIFHLVDMLEDENVIEHGASVSEAAQKALNTCLLEDPTLLIRFFFEKLSQKERRIQSLQTLHRLMLYSTDIPPQFAHSIFNYVLGLLLSVIRSPIDNSQELFISGLTLFWQIIPYVHGLVLKDLKQILRKEQAEMMILVTGNIPSTKKVVIHGPDASQIPTQAIISEDTQFASVLQEALEFFGIPDAKRDHYHLIDIKTQQIHIPETYVRDFYFFRRNIYPQLSLVHMDSSHSQRQLENTAVQIKTIELAKVLFARYFLENTPFNQMHNSITFFHDEIMKSPLFPRKQLESDFNLYRKMCTTELCSLDMLHKYNWLKLIGCLFFNMDGKTSTTSDITPFIPIINGSFILYCEDSMMLRFCVATYINIVKHFRHIFVTNGYLLIMPTFLRVYSTLQSNPMVKSTIEFCCRQFFTLHRIPFILQMLGSISQLLDFDEQTDVIQSDNILSIGLFRLLIALEKPNADAQRDEYSILELIKTDLPRTDPLAEATFGQGTPLAPTTPIKSLDFCYTDDDNIFTFLNCFDACVTVIAYAPDSIRALQMLGVMDILLPKYLQHLKARTTKTDVQKQARDEMKILVRLSMAMKTLTLSLESLARAFVEPKSETSTSTYHKLPRGSYCSSPIVPDEDSVSRFIDDRPKNRVQDADELKQVGEFRWPRNTLLSLISTFVYLTSPRAKELSKVSNDPTHRNFELFDIKSHLRVADITHTLLKLASFDPVTLSCRGIQNYFQKLAPCTDWNQEQLRPALNLLLRRIDRVLAKISKKPATKRCFNWEATIGILNGIYLTIDRYPAIAYFPNLKTLISSCINLLLNENIIDPSPVLLRSDILTFPSEFSHIIIKLVGRYLLAIKSQANIEALTANNLSSPNPTITINHLLHFLLPLMFWASSGRKDAPKLHAVDISYIVTILLNSIKPPSKLAVTMGTQSGPSGQTTSGARQHLTVGEATAPSSNLSHKSIKQLRELLHTSSLLGLKILIIGFSKQLKREWQRLTQGIKSICNKQSNISSNLLSFIDFLVSYKTPIYLLLRPFLMHYTQSVTSDNSRDFAIITTVQQKILFEKIPVSKSNGEILHGLRLELNQLKADVADESKVTNASDIRSISTGKVRFDVEALGQAKDLDNLTIPLTSTSSVYWSSTAHHFRQQRLLDYSLDTSPKRRMGIIRGRDALNILQSYHERYRIRCGELRFARSVSDTSSKTIEDIVFRRPSRMTNDIEASISTDSQQLRTSSLTYSPTSLARSLTVTSDRSLSTLNSDNFMNENTLEQSSSIGDQNTSKLRTFRGWKRYPAHVERSRSPKGSERSKASNTNDQSRSTEQVHDQSSDVIDICEPGANDNFEQMRARRSSLLLSRLSNPEANH
ncbi:unnamed protein product [Adineta ricciae]|uniref:Uncharacterized protein n=1 Tax=Adineta ricciae TaxID=249248 RepID=A0A815IZ94_ADIRI|nr:unnamed protein product [Adineta ricciae]